MLKKVHIVAARRRQDLRFRRRVKGGAIREATPVGVWERAARAPDRLARRLRRGKLLGGYRLFRGRS